MLGTIVYVRKSLKVQTEQGFTVVQTGTGGDEVFARLKIAGSAEASELTKRQQHDLREHKAAFDLVPDGYQSERWHKFPGAAKRQVCFVFAGVIFAAGSHLFPAPSSTLARRRTKMVEWCTRWKSR